MTANSLQHPVRDTQRQSLENMVTSNPENQYLYQLRKFIENKEGRPRLQFSIN